MRTFLIYFLIIIIIFSFIKKIKNNNEILNIKSKIDNRKYIVRKMDDADLAADKLAKININVLKLINHVKDDKRDGVDRLSIRYDPNELSETGRDSKYTSYSVNKGEKISLCIRNKNDDKLINDDNIIMFVVIHELSHIMTIQVGHPKEFWDNMRYLLEKANEINIYNPEDYKKYPKMYCGMEINSTPYKI